MGGGRGDNKIMKDLQTRLAKMSQMLMLAQNSPKHFVCEIKIETKTLTTKSDRAKNNNEKETLNYK